MPDPIILDLHLILDVVIVDVGEGGEVTLVSEAPADHVHHDLLVVLRQHLAAVLPLPEARTLHGDTVTYLSGYNPEKNGKEAPVWGVAQFGEMSYPGS